MLFSEIKILDALHKEKKRLLKKDGQVLSEVNRILQDELFSEQNILRNLKSYNKTFDLLDETGLDKNKLFSINEIKNICIQYDLRFLDSQKYKGGIPAEAIVEIKEISRGRKKPLENFKIMGPLESFKTKNVASDPMLFAETSKGNYYLVHQWDHKVSWYKPILIFPFRSIENLTITIVSFCAIIAMITPQSWIMDVHTFGYWDMHRFALFFHMFIVMGGMTVFLMMAFHRGFTSGRWDEDRS
jgi:hypothetical protein